MKNKHALIPVAVAALALLCFLFVAFCMAAYVQPLWGKTAVLLLPSLILGFVGFLAFRGKLNADKTMIVTAILSVVLLVTSFFYTIYLSILSATTVTTDVKFYSRAYQQIEHEDYLKGIFPEEIPADAEDVSFCYHPSFLQGGEVFELSYVTTGGVLSEWTEFLSGEAEWVGSNEEWHRTNNWGFDGEEAVRYQLYWDGGYNHGELAYVLIDCDENRITFYYENW